MPDLSQFFNWPDDDAAAAAQQFQKVAVIPGKRLNGFHAYNKVSTAGFLFIYDATATIPNGSSLPARRVYPMAGNQSLDIQIQQGQFTRGFTNGIVMQWSNTDTSFTSRPAELKLDVQYS